MEAFVVIWVLLIFLVLLNGFSAGMVAAFHVWRGDQTRRSRALKASAITGVIPVFMFIPTILAEAPGDTGTIVGIIVVLAFGAGLAMAVSLPGALVMARKLEGPGDAYRAFE